MSLEQRRYPISQTSLEMTKKRPYHGGGQMQHWERVSKVGQSHVLHEVKPSEEPGMETAEVAMPFTVLHAEEGDVPYIVVETINDGKPEMRMYTKQDLGFAPIIENGEVLWKADRWVSYH